MKSLFLFLFSFLLFPALLWSQKNAPQKDVPQNKVVIYEDLGFSNISMSIPAKWEANGSWAYFDEKISSIRVSQGSFVMLYEDEGFKGARKLISSDWEAKGGDSIWNDEVSSIRILDSNKPFTLVYQCFVNRDGQWQEMDNFSLLSSGRLFLGLAEITEIRQGGNDMAFEFDPHGAVLQAGSLQFTDTGLNGWLQSPGGEKLAIYGEVNDVYFSNQVPRSPRKTLNEKPRSAIAAERARQKLIDQFGSMPMLSGFITCYKGDRFDGESIILENSWDGRGNSDWYGKIRSVRLAPGWAIRVYSHTRFRGSGRDLTENWSVADDPDWYGNIGSVKIIRKAYTNAQGFAPGYITCFKGDRFDGESIILDESWDGRGNSDWYEKIRSIRIPQGCAVRVYSTTDFRGSSRDLTGNWSVANDPDWYGNVGSVKFLRKGQVWR